MMKKSLLAKSLGSIFVSAVVVGAISCTHTPSADQKIQLDAFSNLTANIQALSTKTNSSVEIISAEEKINERIIAQIESEVKTKIKQTKYAVTKSKPVVPVVKEVIAKNWNDIKPEFADIKYESVKVVEPQEATEALINNKDLIKLYGFNPLMDMKYEVFANINLSPIKEELVKDEVSQSMASTHVEAEVKNPEVASDDMVMFDYSENQPAVAENVSEEVIEAEVQQAAKEAVVVTETSVPKKMFDSPLSSNVKNAIARELGRTPSAIMNTRKALPKTEKVEPEMDDESLNEVMNNEDNVVYDYSQDKASSTKAASFADALKADVDNQAEEKEFIIKAREINLSTQKSRPAIGYEFVPDYDRSERLDDAANGEIKVGYSLTSEMNTQTGVVQSQGMIPTRVELNLAEGGMNVPLINDEGIQKFLIKKGMDIQGNLAMVAVDPSIKDVELDSEYAAKMYFDKTFKNVDSVERANFVMFLGVQTGNTLIRYLLDNNEAAQKIIYIGDGEMFFEDASFVATHREMFTFTTRSLLGKKVKELSVDASLIGIFGTKTTAKKKAINAYDLKIPEMISGARKYLEFKHMPATLYVGTDDEKNIEIPGMDFIKRVLQANDMDELGQRCVVQINLSKDIRDIKVNGKNKAGEMFTETSFLDADGNFSTDNAELSEKIFILGDMEGQFSAKLEYSDGSSQFLKTFCSEGSYLIEQL